MLKKISKYIFILVSFIVLTIGITKKIGPSNLDIWYLLKTGEFIFENKQLMWNDVFSWAADGHVNSMHEWGAAVLFYVVLKYYGFVGLIIITTLISTITFYIVYKILDLYKVSSYIIGLVLVMMFGIFFDIYFVTRPQIFTYLFFVWLIYLIENFYRKKELIDWGNDSIWKIMFDYFKWIPLIFILWANFHGGVVLGVSYLGLYLCYEIIVWLKSLILKKKSDIKLQKMTLLFFGLVIIATISALFNPSFHEVFLYIFRIEPKLAAKFIVEWRPILHFLLNDSQVLFIRVLILLFATYIFLFSINRDLAILTIFVYLVMTNVRHLPLLTIVMIIFGLKLLFQEIKNKKIFENDYFIIFSWFLMGGLVIFMFNVQTFGFGVNKTYLPEKQADFIIDNKLEGKLFNDYGQGGYLIYRLYPQMQVYIDGRLDLYLDNNVFAEYINMIKLNEEGRELFINKDFDLILVPNVRNKRNIARYIEYYMKNYKLVVQDKTGWLFIKEKPAYMDIINLYKIDELEFPEEEKDNK